MTSVDINLTKKKNRRNIVVLILVFILPMVISWIILKNIDSFKPSGSRNFGELVHPARPLLDFKLHQADGSTFDLQNLKGKWGIIYFGVSDCDQVCQGTLSKIHQARLAQGKEMHRLRHFYVNTETKALSATTTQFIKPLTDISIISGDATAIQNFLMQFEATGHPPKDAGRIYLIDPLGNIMMTYTNVFTVRDLLKDLEHLLKYSQIG